MRRLICISNSIADTFKWRTSMGLSNHHIRHWSPYENPNKMRGLSEVNNAIVWVDRPALSSDHYLVLDRYRALSILEFDGRQRTVILDWLRADNDPSAVPIDEKARRAHDCGEYVVARLVQIIRVAVTCAAIATRAELHGYNSGWADRNKYEQDRRG